MNQQTELKQYNFTEAEVAKLFAMQDQLNAYIHPEWKTQGFNWGRAIVDECMEIHGHLGWKWWKKDYQIGLHEGNRKQVQLEVIDILHFVVSFDNCTARAFAAQAGSAREWSLELAVDVLIKRITNRNYDFLPAAWAALAHSVGLTKTQILETYTQKYVLNKFRQNHGYKTGEYQKHWECEYNGHGGLFEEDNYWLEQVVTQLKQANHSTTDEILLYSELERLYNSRLNKV